MIRDEILHTGEVDEADERHATRERGYFKILRSNVEQGLT